MDEIYKDKIALFRYGIIAPLVTAGDVSPKQRADFFRDASQKTYTMPDGKIVTFSIDTLYRYYKKGSIPKLVYEN